MPRRDRFLERLFAPVTPDDLETALRLFGEMPAEDADYEGRTLRLIEYYHQPGNEPADGDVAAKISAINFRLEALASLSNRPEMKAWTIPADGNGEYLNGVLLAAAATEPIVKKGKYRVTFKADTFFNRVLELADMDGQA